ncbi:Squalene epoxidase, partial [Linderina macrospora]
MTAATDTMQVIDENDNWPTQGTYEFAEFYSSREQIITFDRMDTDVMTKSFDFVVIGAGPVGAALAFRISKDHPDRNILLVEKNWNEPDRFVGELMQPAGCQALERLGLGNAFKGIEGVPVHGYYVAYKGKHIYIPYIKEASGKRFKGVSFHHGRLVMQIRAAAKSRPNITCLEASVTELIADYKTVNGVSSMTTVRGVRIGPVHSTPEGDKSYAVMP